MASWPIAKPSFIAISSTRAMLKYAESCQPYSLPGTLSSTQPTMT